MKLKIKQHATALLSLPLSILLMISACKPKESGDTMTGSTNAATDVDNSRINARDRDGATLTPGDQGNTPADVQLTQQIRKVLVSGTANYSATAKNIKIVTANGKVTLRGPVNSAAEKTGIVALAKSIAGEANVEDQLEVKATL